MLSLGKTVVSHLKHFASTWILPPLPSWIRLACRDFINVFNRRETGGWGKPPVSETIWSKLRKEHFPLYGQTSQAKSSSQPVNLHGAQPVMKPLWYTNRSGDISIWQRTANKSNVWSASTDDPVHDIQSNWWSLRLVTLVNVIHVCLKYWFKVFTPCYVSKYCMIQKLPLVLKFHGFSLRCSKRS